MTGSAREARLLAEYGGLYPYLVAGQWESAAVVADRIVAHILGRPDGHFITSDRALDPIHFEFRGGTRRSIPAGAQRREDG